MDRKPQRGEAPGQPSVQRRADRGRADAHGANRRRAQRPASHGLVLPPALTEPAPSPSERNRRDLQATRAADPVEYRRCTRHGTPQHRDSEPDATRLSPCAKSGSVAAALECKVGVAPLAASWSKPTPIALRREDAARVLGVSGETSAAPRQALAARTARRSATQSAKPSTQGRVCLYMNAPQARTLTDAPSATGARPRA